MDGQRWAASPKYCDWVTQEVGEKSREWQQGSRGQSTFQRKVFEQCQRLLKEQARWDRKVNMKTLKPSVFGGRTV